MFPKTQFLDRLRISVFKADGKVKCPKCGKPLVFADARMSMFPYPHADLKFKCCGKDYVFGFPFEKESGLELVVLGHVGLGANLVHLFNVKPPLCPFHDVEMWHTKIFHDIPKQGDARLQWKCPKCFLTIHKNMENDKMSPKKRKKKEYYECFKCGHITDDPEGHKALCVARFDPC